MKKIIVYWVVFSVFFFSHAFAANFKSITAAELKKLLDKREQLVLVDARTGEEYSKGHIPTSVNIPPEKLGSIGTFLPKKKDTLIVIYCRGIG